MKCLVCGYGVVGRNVAETLDLFSIEYTVIEKDRSVKALEGVPIVYGDAKDEELLTTAGIDDSEILITCTGSDAENAFIMLVAQDLNPEIRVLSRAEELESVDKLYMAGSDYVISLAQIAAKTMVRMAILPYISELEDYLTVTKDVVLTTVKIPKDSDLVGRSLRGSRLEEITDVSIIGIRRGDAVISNPGPDVPFIASDVLVIAGQAVNLKLLSRVVKGEEPAPA